MIKKELPKSKYDENGRPINSKFLNHIKIHEPIKKENNFRENNSFSSNLEKDFDKIKTDFDSNNNTNLSEVNTSKIKLSIIQIFLLIISFLLFFPIGIGVLIYIISYNVKNNNFKK